MKSSKVSGEETSALSHLQNGVPLAVPVCVWHVVYVGVCVCVCLCVCVCVCVLCAFLPTAAPFCPSKTMTLMRRMADDGLSDTSDT